MDDCDDEAADAVPAQDERPAGDPLEVHTVEEGQLLLLLDWGANATPTLQRFGDACTFVTGPAAEVMSQRVARGQRVELYTAAHPTEFDPVRQKYGVKVSELL